MDTKALRQRVLDLAIRGKLVPQDPDDEPASALLERIRQQKQQMVKDGKLKAKDIKNDKSAISTCSGPDCGQIWGQKRFLTRGGRCLPAPVGKRFFVREITRFPAAAGWHPWPPAYPGS